MAKVENKCTNCRYPDSCKTALRSRVVIWKHCEKFKPSARAIEDAAEQERIERRKRIFGYR